MPQAGVLTVFGWLLDIAVVANSTHDAQKLGKNLELRKMY